MKGDQNTQKIAHVVYGSHLMIVFWFTGLRIMDTCGNPSMTTTRIISLASDYGLLIHLSPSTNFSGNEIGKPISKVSCKNSSLEG